AQLIEWQHQEQIHIECIRDKVQEQAAKDAAHREIAMCLLSSHMLLNWLLLERIILFFESILRC
ncbi:MAG: hypothetical protein ACJ71I_15150, partial [Nitrososphaeraceae archaeon]